MFDSVRVPLGALNEDEGNPREISKDDFEALIRSLGEFGLVEPFVARAEDKRIVGGHQRGKAVAEYLRRKGVPEELIRTQEVTVVHIPGLSESKCRALNLALNRIHGGWSDLLLPAYVAPIEAPDLVFTGFDATELQRLLAPPPSAVINDEVPPLPSKAVSKPGDVWQLGRHLMHCGDCRDGKLWKGVALKLIWTDPPYGVAYEGGMKKRDKIQNDGGIVGVVQLLETLFPFLIGAAAPGVAWYVAGALNFTELHLLLQRLDVYRQTLIWDKGSFALGRSDYRYAHEPIHYGWTPGAAHRWFGNRDKSTMLRFPRPSRNEDHPTMKPPELIAHCIENSSQQGDLVGDPFMGSGSTMMAAEQTGRAAFGVEIEPRYVDVQVQRWEKFTGGKAVLLPGSPSLKGKAKRSRKAATAA